jgi:hypothetical protein
MRQQSHRRGRRVARDDEPVADKELGEQSRQEVEEVEQTSSPGDQAHFKIS